VKRSPLKFRSKKQASAYVLRREFVKGLLEEFPWCQIRWDSGCEGRATEVDEIKSRAAGGSILDRANCQTTCHHCHRQKHLNPVEAHARGFTRWSWEDAA
jgi:5-methylcytosine-specific restriction endonuclease McrA